MSDPILYLDRASGLNLQAQIRQKLVEAIHLEVFPAGTRLPSSRKLAEQLGVARNTVVHACQQLVDEGLLSGRARSGLYVTERIPRPVAEPEGVAARSLRTAWRGTERPDQSRQRRLPYCFVDGEFDGTLFPTHEWREASRLALGSGEIAEWAANTGDDDDARLIEQLRTKILPARGISARAEEILVTSGAEQALFLLLELLVEPGQGVAVEEPGSPALRRQLARRGARMVHQGIDDEGLVVDGALKRCRLVCVTPSHQSATGVTMSLARRRDLLATAALHGQQVIEDDVDCESNYLGYPHAALRGMDRDDRVVYVSGLAKPLAPGIRLGFMVGSPEVIAAARRLRRSIGSPPSRHNQRAMAHFIGLGHYDAFTRQLHTVFGRRWLALREALNFYLPPWVMMAPAHGGTVIWVRGSEELDTDRILAQAAARGVLIEPADPYYAGVSHPKNCFRLGVSGITEEHIRDGVAALAAVVRAHTAGAMERLEDASGERLDAATLEATLAGATMHTRRVYGEPLDIRLNADGSMEGRAGPDGQDSDTGRWWVEGDRWVRQWSRWSYGEPASYAVVIDTDRIKFYLDTGLIEDTLHYEPPPR